MRRCRTFRWRGRHQPGAAVAGCRPTGNDAQGLTSGWSSSLPANAIRASQASARSKTTTQRRAVQRGRYRLAGSLNLGDDGRNLRVLQRLNEFAQVGAGHEGGAAPMMTRRQVGLGLQLLYRGTQVLAYRQ